MAANDQDLPQVGDTIAAKYKVEQVLGRGGMGAVFRVRHSVTGKSFAVKWLLPQLNAGPETAQRFIREAQVAGRVDHPNVVEVYDIGEDRGSMFMVMELLHGESLAQRLAHVGRVPYSQACQLLIGVTRGLAAAHRSGVIHRDLKPDNIFLSVSSADTTREPRPKILDFGISKISALATDANPALTREGVVMGTPHYMAPEQLRSHKLDERCDIYALGVILYQMLSGELPFVGQNFPDLMLKIVGEAAVPLAQLAPEAPRELVAIVETAMSRNAAERFESAADLGRALEPFGEGARFDVEQPVTVRPPASVLPGPTTPVATESRFPEADSQAIGPWQRARRLSVPIAASAVSAALACWIYVSLDNQPATPPTASDLRLEQSARGAAAASESGMTTPPLPKSQGALPAAQPPTAASEPNRLPQPHITTIAALDSASDTPSPAPASAAARPLAAKSEPDALPEPSIHALSSLHSTERDALPEPHITGLAAVEASAAAAPGGSPSLIGAGGLPGVPPASASAPASPQGTGAIAPPSPMPPPGAAGSEQVGRVALPLTDRSEAKPRKPASKKPSAKFESPEIRIHDFYQ